MDWLLHTDTELFRYLNGALVNPVFDRLMPALSGYHVPWLAAIIVSAPVLLWFGSVRLRICLAMMVLVVALGDPLVIGTIKDSVRRPRPFVVLKEARLYVPQARRFDTNGIRYVAPLPDGSLPSNANRHSFPSAHAANWFAIATVGFLFYRRSAFWLFPLAAAVAFSRVYNGVHYPGDVTIGAILGAGYAIALLVLAQMLWNVIGKKYFPKAHARLPHLLHPESLPAKPETQPVEK
jgi:undecaprenyl-diphosphatase